jgi:hypothetical protein
MSPFKIIILLFIFQNINAQDSLSQSFTSKNKGKFYFYWGGNRGYFSTSDINFYGKDYNFTLQNVIAKDKPYGFHIDYINPSKMTIPQTNFRMGYFINDKYSITLGYEHMKYVVLLYQTVKIDGYINATDPDNSPNKYNGIYNDREVIMYDDFVELEHTDGLNYVNVDITRHDDVTKWLGNWNTDKFQIQLFQGVGAGVVIPRTNATILNYENYDKFNLAGVGISAKTGLSLTFFKYFQINSDLKAGYINMYNVKTTNNPEEGAKHSFWFLQTMLALGGIYNF